MNTMHKSLLVVLMVLSFGLTSCSTNTQKENTAVGAVSGAVLGGLAGSLIGGGTGQAVAIGVGIVGGALIGGYIGKNMDSSDNANMNAAMDKPTGHSTSWKNDKTDSSYTVTPTSNKMTMNGQSPCRHFNTTAIINGKTEHVHGVACQQSDGTWKAVKS